MGANSGNDIRFSGRNLFYFLVDIGVCKLNSMLGEIGVVFVSYLTLESEAGVTFTKLN